MWIRISAALAAGSVITGALIYWMQFMIAGGPADIPAPPPFRIIAMARVVEPPEPTRRDRPDPPDQRQEQPEFEFHDPIPTTDPLVHGARVKPTRAPGPPRSADGRRGPWGADTDLILLAQMHPTYPYTALTREMEGFVVVGFSVSRLGETSDIRIIESSDAVFDQSAIAAVSRTRYRPRIVDGAPVPVYGMRTRLQYSLDD